MLTVNAPPTLSEAAADIERNIELPLNTTGAALTLITAANAVALFDDPEDDTVTASFASSNVAVATVNAGALTLVSRGRTTITLTGTTAGDLGLGQSTKIEYTVTVK